MMNAASIRKKKIVIIADDLTGANEIASLVVKEGKKPLVLIHPPDNHIITELWKSYDSLVVNLNSRNLSPQRAYHTVKDFLISSRTVRERLAYKKIDSTLRGNVGKEIDAVLDAECAEIAVLVPALPKMGRVTVGGHHLVNGLPVGRTSYAQTSTGTFLSGFLQLQAQCSHQVGYIGLESTESGPDTICQQLVAECKKGSSIIICDCCSQGDLENIRQAIVNLNVRVLPVGSAGLFEELFKEDESHFLPSLIACGSLNRISRFQLTKLMDEERNGYLELDVSSLLSKDKQEVFKNLVLEGEAILSQGRNLSIATSEKRWGDRKNETHMMRSKIDQSLAWLAKHFIESFPLAGVIVTGGDTAMALLDVLCTQSLEIVGEVEPFVPIGIVRGGKWEGMVIITKTGGFGREDVFLKALDYLDKRSRRIER